MPTGIFKRTKEHNKHISEALKGKPSKLRGTKFTEEHKRKIGLSKMKELNPNWVGDKIKYNGLHTWVKSRLKKTKLCECCKKVPPYDLANKGIYNRDLENWEWLCRKCHMVKDGRMVNIHSLNKKGINNGHNKLTDKQVVYIKKSKFSVTFLSKKFNVSKTNISSIRNNKTWKHIKIKRRDTGSED